MSAAKKIAVAMFSLGVLLVPAAQASAAAAPAWQVSLIPMPTNLQAGTTGKNNTDIEAPMFRLLATNIGAKETSGPVTFTATLPVGVTPIGSEVTGNDDDQKSPDPVCSAAGQKVTCTTPGPVYPSRWTGAIIPVEVSTSASGLLSTEATISGGEAQPVSTIAPTEISPEPPAFGFLPGSTGLSALLTEEDGSASTRAGSHPNQMTINLAFPTEHPETGPTKSAGHVRDVITNLPQGLIVNPSATPERCTELEFLSGQGAEPGCPDGSQIGVINAMTEVAGPAFVVSHLYNMVPPPGAPAEIAFNALEVGIFVHLAGHVRSESDYGITATSEDILARTNNPVLDIQVQIWGDPSSDSHREIRGECRLKPSITCPLAPQRKPTLSMPSACSASLGFAALADSWEQRGDYVRRETLAVDTSGTPVGVSGCNALEFEPTITSQPTTNLADSPSGLDFDLHQPQDQDKEHLATAELRDATVTLPAGLVANPSQAGGLDACSEAEIGYLVEDEEAGIHFSNSPQSCPDAAKIGSLEVASPALAQYTEDGTKLETDPETGEAIPRPLHGSVYLAEPFHNPFGTMLALYLAVEDPQSGIFAKLAGRIEPDPKTGQLTTVFTESPELPLEDVRLHLFNGPRASLTTPQTCATHTTTSTLTPWSTPEGADAEPEDSFQTTASPNGGPCPTEEGQAPNAPAFSAGTLSPQAGAYSPFVLKLSREDGSQRLTGLDTRLPPGLAARFAGVGECSAAQIAQAQSRNKPNQGALELASPSCPASSQVGSVDVAAGAGPTPFHTTGHAYLAGPYKGAPLSLAIITPAIAGPFDLGTVVVRTALYVNPDTAQGRAVSDPLPQILEGIPLDLRSVTVTLDRPHFTLNPTSCDKMAVTGTATSALGSLAPLTSPFQVGGCPALPFKPKLSLTLKGKTRRTSHPRLIANLRAKPGEANIARAQVKLPKAAFLDNAHIKTICTNVQFRADTCPSGSIYGKASATTPLLDGTLSGPVYLRSSSHALPDLVVKLRGPDSQPVEIDLAGKTDSVGGALRNTFEAVPDAPVTKFHLELFGGKRGLIILSAGLCKSPRATVALEGQNGKLFDTNPVVKTSCPKKKHKKHRKHH